MPSVEDETHYEGDGCEPPHIVSVPSSAANANKIMDQMLARVKGIQRELGRPNTIDEAYQVEVAENLLSSMETWQSTPEDHRAETPLRFVRQLKELTTPTDYDARFKTFPNKGTDEMVVVGPIRFYTLCAHHVIPFFGHAWIGYVPGELIAGLSKFARVVEGISKGFHVQEELTELIAQYLNQKLEPRGVAVMMRAEHLCMAMRGVRSQDVITTTTRTLGVFADHSRTAKAEFLSAVERSWNQR